MFDTDTTDLSPYEYNDCAQPGCNVTVRNAQFCKSHDRAARARELAKVIELERCLVMSLTGGTTDPATLRRLATLSNRSARLAAYAVSR